MQKNSNGDRNLSEVFSELRKSQIATKNVNNKKRVTTNSKPIKKKTNNKNNNRIVDIKLTNAIAVLLILLFFMILIFSKSDVFARSSDPVYEVNDNVIDIQNIIYENSDINKFKEQVTKPVSIPFETQYTDNPSLPQREEVVTQEGILGWENVTSVKTYESKKLVDEIILYKEPISDPTPRLVDVGTSEFLTKHKIHIGDSVYLLNTRQLKKSNNNNSANIKELKEGIDVILLEISDEEWCKVSFDGTEGYVPASELTSSSSTPEILELNRKQRILLEVKLDMSLDAPSSLTLEDYKKIFTGLPQDTKHIFQDNYTSFYDAENKYKVNGIFLASIAIHESGWGTSKIANDKKNLFGFGSYDRNPYEYSLNFTDYSDGINSVAKALAKNYLYPSGTKISDEETASGSYYNGPHLSDVNKRYASDQEWHKKVFKYMDLLYNRLI